MLSAVEAGNAAELLRAIQSGGSPDAAYEDGASALIIAAMRGNATVVRLLLDSGASVNSETVQGMTALNAAIVLNYPQIVKLLLEAGADPNHHRAGHPSPLRAAREIAGTDPEIERLLEAAGAEVDRSDEVPNAGSFNDTTQQSGAVSSRSGLTNF